MEIKTRSIPEELFFSVTGQVGYNSNVGLGGQMLSFDGGDIGFWGTNIDRFNISNEFLELRKQYGVAGGGLSTENQINATQNNIRNALANGVFSETANIEAQRINRIYEQFSPVLSTSLRTPLSNQIYSVSFGNRYADTLKLFGRPFINLGNKELGFFVGLNYYRRIEAYSGVNNRYSVREPGLLERTPNVLNPNIETVIRRFTFNEDYAIDLLNYGILLSGSIQINPKNSLSISYNGSFGAESFADRLIGSTNVSINPVVPTADIATLPSTRSSNATYSLRATERPFNTWQVRGEHAPFYIKVPDEKVKINWSFSSSKTSQNDPDFCITDILIDSLGIFLPSGNRLTQIAYLPNMTRYWRFLEEVNYNARFDITIPVKLTIDSVSRVTFKAGGFYLSRERDYTESEVRRFESKEPDPNRPETSGVAEILLLSQYGLDLSSLGGDIDAWAGPNALGIIENAGVMPGNPYQIGFLYNPSNTGNGYNGKQIVTAFYSMADFNLSKKFRALGGVRIENTDTQALVDTTNLILDPSINTRAEFDSIFVTNQLEYKWLPSMSLIYSPMDNIKLRLAYSQTLARPELNEIINTKQFDPIQQAFIRGNNRIRNASYTNYDFRVDWFIRKEEIISASVFYKTINKQLERVFLPSLTSEISSFGRTTDTITFRNNPEDGFLYGLELEFRINLGETFKVEPLKNFFFGLNGFLAYSENPFPPDELYVRRLLNRDARGVRPLFDQPNYIVNANFGWEKEDWGAAYNVFFNWTGDRLSEINIDGTPNVYERSAPELDFIFSQRLFRKKIEGTDRERHKLVLNGFVKNILYRPTEFIYKNGNRPGDDLIDGQRFIRRAFTRGIEVAAGLRYTF